MSLFDVVIVQPIFNLLMGIYSLIPDFGVSIVIFTIIVRFALWPLAKKQLHQAKAMRKMQPELKKLQAKYKNNKQAQSMAMLDLYKKYNIGPFRSIAVLLIQLPILIGVYRVVQIFVMHREELGKFTYDIMEQLPTVGNLVQHPDQFNQNFLGIMDLTKHAVSPQGVAIGLVAFAALAAVLQYLLSKQTAPQSDSGKRLRDVLAEAEQGKEADQAEVNAIVMRKMMKFMPIFLFFIMINLPGALALYMTTSNAVAYIQNKMILRQDGDELEKIASEKQQKNAKKSPKQRAANAKEANVTRIKAKD
jgi:YidC/Oxa1 family membrane protein insertase